MTVKNPKNMNNELKFNVDEQQDDKKHLKDIRI